MIGEKMGRDEKVSYISDRLEEVMDALCLARTESNRDTPRRVARMWVDEFFPHANGAGEGRLLEQMKVFPNVYGSEMVVVRGVPFSSTCEHHWLPFSGTASVGYVPNERVCGLSKIPRVVRHFSKKPQLQEKLTADIGGWLWEVLAPRALFVEVVARHQCVMCRGAESDCETVTYYRKFEPGYERYWEEFKCRR